jgi:hypothetical protein
VPARDALTRGASSSENVSPTRQERRSPAFIALLRIRERVVASRVERHFRTGAFFECLLYEAVDIFSSRRCVKELKRGMLVESDERPDVVAPKDRELVI